MFKKIKQLMNKRNAFIASIALLLTVCIGGTLGYIIDETDWITNIFKSGLHPEGDLIIQKDVEHPFGDTYQIPSDLSFDFVLDFGSEYEGTSVLVSGQEQEIIDKKLTVQVKPNTQVKVEDILAGTKVKVTESTKPGFSEKNNQSTQEIVIEKLSTKVLTFTNVYTPTKVQPVNVELKVEKKLEGDRTWLESDKFTFNLEVQKEDLTWEILSSKDATFNERIVDFTEVLQTYAFDSMKTYSFRITEVEETNIGITYDQIKYFDIKVNDLDMDGKYEIESVESSSANTTVTKENNQFKVDMIITNTYHLEGESSVYVNITKEIENITGGSINKSGYVFVLYDELGNELKRSEPTSQAGEAIIKLTYLPEHVGNTYTYKLKELNAGETIGTITYDSKEVEIKVNVIDKLDGTIQALFEDQTNELKVTFKNIYKAEASDPITLTGTKELIGRELFNEFEFELYATDNNYNIINNTPIKTTINDLKDIKFEGLTFDKVNTYYYVIKEKDTQKGGVTYDKTTYQVKVEVIDQDGKLVAIPTIMDEFGNETSIVFTNTYKASPTTVTLSGKKELTGLTLKEEMFAFNLYKADENYKTQGEIESVTNDTSGNFKFKALEFKEEGTYYFVIKEDSTEPINGVTYDTTEYQVKVEVKDDKNGKLVASVISKDIIFKNTYSPKDTNTVITGNKVLNGYNLESNMFTFELLENNKVIQTTTNKEDGTFSFNSITYNKVGKHTYYVKEKATSSKLQECITFDTSVYKVDVEVKDKNGQLVATQTITKDNQEIKQIIFTNTYTPQTEDVIILIEINKTVKSKGTENISPEGFKFILKKNDTKVSEVTSDKAGKAFIELTFTKDDIGIHDYKLSEIDDKQKDIRYSTDVYKINITVELDENNQLVITQAVDNKIVDNIKCTFINTYYKGAVDTGDDSNIFLYVSVSIISILVLLILIYIDYKNKRKSD